MHSPQIIKALWKLKYLQGIKYYRAYYKKRTKERVAKGLCSACGRKARKGFAKCKKCNERSSIYKMKNREKIKKMRKKGYKPKKQPSYKKRQLELTKMLKKIGYVKPKYTYPQKITYKDAASLREKGLNNTQIALQLNVHKTTIGKLFKKLDPIEATKRKKFFDAIDEKIRLGLRKELEDTKQIDFKFSKKN